VGARACLDILEEKISCPSRTWNSGLSSPQPSHNVNYTILAPGKTEVLGGTPVPAPGHQYPASLAEAGHSPPFSGEIKNGTAFIACIETSLGFSQALSTGAPYSFIHLPSMLYNLGN